MQQPSLPAEEAPHPQRVLCADDDADIRAVLAIALGEIGGFEVSLCDDGDQVVHRACISPPDLILLDTRMPRMDGPSTLACLRQDSATRNIPVAFLTADQQIVSHWREHHPVLIGVIAKPFDPVTLAEEVRELHAGNICS